MRILVEDAEAISDKQENFRKQQHEKLEAMLGSLEYFEKSTTPLRVLLEEKIKAAK